MCVLTKSPSLTPSLSLSSLLAVRFAFLFDTYRIDCFYWEVVVTAKRLTLTGVIMLFEQGSVMQFSVGILTTVISLSLQMRFMP